MSRLSRLLETVVVWTLGPVILFFSPQARVFRYASLGLVGGVAAAWWSGLLLWMAGALVGHLPQAWLGGPVTQEERLIMERTLTDSEDEDSPTWKHTMRMAGRAPAFAKAEGIHPGALEAAVLLHDSTLHHPGIPLEQRFCTHGLSGAVVAVRVLRQMEDRSGWYAMAVGDAVVRHVGPVGFNWEWQDKRWAEKRCPNQKLAQPVSALSKALMDLDLMDQMGVDAVVLETLARKQAPGAEKKTFQDVMRLGSDSLLKELGDNAQSLKTATARSCGKHLVKHVSGFIKGLDYRTIKHAGHLREAAAQYLQANPPPACLDTPAATSEDVEDAALATTAN